MLLATLNRRSTFSFIFKPQTQKILKRTFLFLLFAFFLTSTALKLHAADENPYIQIRNAQKVNKPNLENYKNYSTLTDIFNISSYIGVPQGQTEEDIKNQFKNKSASYVPEGALGVASQLIAQTYTPAASGIQYLAQVKDQILGRPAYAQAGSFTALQPILPLWRGFRNMVYLFSSLLFVFVGFMIIFRVKINPQTVISIQSAIPQLITTLILVTFSYAIAGLLIDVMNLVQGVVLALIFNTTSKQFRENLFTSGPITVGFPAGAPGSSVIDLTKSVTNPFDFIRLSSYSFMTFLNLTWALTPRFALAVLSGVIGALVGGLGGSGIGAIPGALIGASIVSLILGIIILFTLLKLLIGLFKVYLHIVLKIILSPIEIGLGAIPSFKAGFSTWFIDIFANLMVFPIVLLFLVLANLISQSSMAGLWAPGFFDIGNIGISILPTAIGLATLLLVSQLPELIPQAVFALKPSAWEAAIGKSASGAINSPFAALQFAAGTAKNANEIFGPSVKHARRARGISENKNTDPNERLVTSINGLTANTQQIFNRLGTVQRPPGTKG